MNTGVAAGPLGGIVGQTEVVRRLRAAVATPVHAYLFVGPRGTGKKAAARAFAAELLGRDAEPGDAERHHRLALAGRHPDLREHEPEGRTFRVVEAEQVVIDASRSPVEGPRKVIVCDRFHTAEPVAAASLLKTIEEPPPSTVFVLLAEDVPPEHVTIASRCTQLDFAPLDAVVLAGHLGALGVDADRARLLAAMAGGNLERAELLATDPAALRRLDAWRSVPDRLDGTGAAVAVLVEEVRSLIDDAQAPLATRHAEELDSLAEQEQVGAVAAGARKTVTERHKREARLLRDDELRAGLAALAGRYRDLLVADPDDDRWARAIGAIGAATEALERNPNEPLLLQALLLRLPPAS